MGKRIKTLLLIGIGIFLAFQWPPGPGNTVVTDIFLVLAIFYAWPALWKHKEIVRFPLILPQFMILLGSLSATMVSVDQTSSLTALAQDVYIYLWFLSLVNMIDDEADFQKMRKAWALVACLMGLLMVLAMAGIGRTLFVMPLKAGPQPIPGTAGQSNRAMGTIGHPNKTGDYLMISFFVFLSLRYPQKIWQRVLIGLVLVAGIFTTGSNAAILGCLVGGLVILAFRIARSDGKSPLLLGLVTALLGGLACLVAIIAIIGVPPSLVDFTWGTFLQNSIARLLAGGPVAGRMRTWSLALEAYLSHPLGIGPDAFATWIGAGTVHNDYLSHLVERGPLGFIGLLLLVIEVLVCLSASMALTKGDPGRQFQVLALGAGFVGSIIVGMSHEVMHWRHHWLLITLIFAQNKLLRIRGADTDTLVSARDTIPEYHHVQIPEG